MTQKTVDTALIGRFKAVFQASGLGQDAFGASIGQRQNAISQVVGGSREPSKAMLQSIITKYDISPEWLFSGSGNMRKTKEATGEFLTREDFAEWRGYWKAGTEKLLEKIEDLTRRVDQLEKRVGASE